jgi:ubiquinone biosynthesis monooxygenase Coq6
MVENVNLTSALLSRLDELGGVEVHDKVKVVSISLGRDMTGDQGPDLSAWPVVKLSSGKEFCARLLVGADGANSPVRSFAEIESQGWDYERHGLVATLEHASEDDHANHDHRIAYQRFLPTGPVAMLPLPGRFSTITWTTTPENAALLKTLAPTDFVAMVNAAFRLRPVDLAYMHSVTEGQADELVWRMQHTAVPPLPAIPREVTVVHARTVASFPLRMRHADAYTAHRVALVGDAAHTTHPLAGQGMNAGQGDVASLARCLEQAMARGLDIGSTMSLAPYASERYLANHVLLGVCDKLHKLYSVSNGPLVPLRSWGLRAVNALTPAKDFFMRQAAGKASLW